ncbi:hypothetical protein P7C70_g7544, partial [Phenoliferia sp. Uapishka_3]
MEPVRVCDGCVKKLKDGKGAVLARSTSYDAGGSTATKLPERSSTVSYKKSARSAGDAGKQNKEDADLQRAIAASLQDTNPSSPSGPAFQLRDQPVAPKGGYNPSYSSVAPVSSAPPADEEEDPDLAAAIAASLRDVPAATSSPYDRAATGAAESYASLYPSSRQSYSYPSATPASNYPTLSRPQSHALPTYDLTPSESSTIENFTSTLERPPPILGSRERELYEDATRAAPRLERGLEDAERRTEMLVEMNDKLGEATRLFESLLDRRVQEARQKANGQSLHFAKKHGEGANGSCSFAEYKSHSQAPAQQQSYYPAPVSYAAPPTSYAQYPQHQPQPLPHSLTSSSPLSPQQYYSPAAPPQQYDQPTSPQHYAQQPAPQSQQQYHHPQQQQPAGYYKASSFPAVPQGPISFPAVPSVNPAEVEWERERREREEADSQPVGELIEL